MTFWKRRKPTVPVDNDLEEARLMRKDAQEQYTELLRQRPRVAQLSAYLTERKELNGFGEEVHVSFTPRKQRHA